MMRTSSGSCNHRESCDRLIHPRPADQSFRISVCDKCSGSETIDAQLRNFALDVLFRRLMASTSSWGYAVKILSSCEESETEPLTRALAEFACRHSRSTR